MTPSPRSPSNRANRRLGLGVGDTEAAFEVLDTEALRPERVLTDLCTPGMNGAVLSRRLAPAWLGRPVILMTGFAGEAIPDGADPAPILVKSFATTDPAEAIRRRLEERRRARRGSAVGPEREVRRIPLE